MGSAPAHGTKRSTWSSFLGAPLRGKSASEAMPAWPPMGVRDAHCAHVQAHLDCNILSKDARVQQQQCLRPLAPIAVTLGRCAPVGRGCLRRVEEFCVWAWRGLFGVKESVFGCQILE